jgi:hypothetical protein
MSEHKLHYEVRFKIRWSGNEKILKIIAPLNADRVVLVDFF